MSCTCGCCAGTRTETPAPVDNPPGRSAIAYRMGTHGQFVASQLARLSSRKYPELAHLTTREPDDLAIALLDSWAVVADILTFYQERTANEGYLRTATEPESLTALGRLVGYEPRPALGSSTYLAYTLDPGARTTVPTGAQSKSTAAPGEQPQTFETSEDLDAREEWNQLQVRRTRPPALDFADILTLTQLDLDGVAVDAKPGDRMVFVFDETDPSIPPVTKVVSASTTVFEQARTTVEFGSAEPVVEYEAALDELADGIDDAVAAAPNHPFARRILDTYLLPLREQVGSRPAAKDFARSLHAVLTLLAEEREIAEVRVIRPVVAWPELDGVLRAGFGTLDTAIRTARVSHPEVEQLRDAADNLARSPGRDSLLTPPRVRSSDGEDCPSAYALVGLLPVLPALRKPPSRPPTNARALELSAQEVFGTESDTLPRLLALDPKVGGALFQALANTDLAKPLPLSSLQILRQRAKPFGANAPLPPRSGDIDSPGPADWPFDDLDAKQILEVVVTYSAGQPAKARLIYRTAAPADGGGDTSVSVEISFDTLPASVELEPGTVDAVGSADGVRLRFGGGLPEREISFSADQNGTIQVTVRTSGAVTLAVGTSPVTGTLGSDSITAKPDDNELTVTDEITPATYVLPLDASYEGITAGQVVVIERPSLPKPLVTRATKVEEVSLAKYNLVGPSTRLTLAAPWIGVDETFLEVRQTSVFVRGEPLVVAEALVPDDIGGGEIELDRLYDGLTPGRRLVVSGERTDIPFTTGVRASELVMLGGVRQTVDPTNFGEKTHTTLMLANDLAYTYRRATVTVLGNVVEATQGETRGQVLGSGDASTPNQTFTLAQSPVTWLPAATPSGAESTLTVRVNGVRRQSVDGLVRLGPTDHGYVARTVSGGATTVTFGDGVHGARLPTGVENVVAGFRLGAGRSGNVLAGAVNQAISRPFGVNAVTNPLPAAGGTDADGPEDMRVAIPLRVRALDRLVSVRDYEDFARARAGIGKASALELTDGEREVVHVTIAGADDAPVDPSSRLFRSLEAALAEFGDVRLPVRVDLRELVLIVLSANVAILPDYSWELVEPAVRAAVLDRFSFANRELGRPAYLSEALAAMQAVAGVDYVDVDIFSHVQGEVDPIDLVSVVDKLTGVNACVPACPARYEERRHDVQSGEPLTWIARLYGLTVAELLRLNPGVDTADIEGRTLLVRRGIRPAQLAVLSPSVPETLMLRRIQ